jgi:peptidoglycan-associated lipoprotein
MKPSIPIVIAAVALQACAGEMHQTSARDTTVTTTAANIPMDETSHFIHVVPWPTFGYFPTRTITLKLGPDALEHCRDVSPKFPFDSDRILVDYAPELEALASCLNHPGMADQSIVLVGRADPRGTEAYNAGLGMRRAESIERFLTDRHVDPGRIEIVSDGKLQAETEARPDFSFGYDRRVDVIVRGVHAPM